MPSAVLETSLGSIPVRRGKVRDIYDLGDKILLVSTDRISAFDWVLPTGIPDKGRVLTQISSFWFNTLNVPDHVISTDVQSVEGLPADADLAPFEGRSMLCRKSEVVKVECVVRGYLAGSGWKEYGQSGTVCGLSLPEGLVECSQLPEPIFTPTTKADEGHDEPMSFEEVVEQVGADTANQLRDKSLEIYRRGAELAREKGIIIADTKFEFGLDDSGQVILIDEALTPDSSRFWPADQYQVGISPPSFDKQFVRDYLETLDWDKTAPGPELPQEIVEQTASKYAEALQRLTS